jgi:hypothetical protein
MHACMHAHTPQYAQTHARTHALPFHMTNMQERKEKTNFDKKTWLAYQEFYTHPLAGWLAGWLANFFLRNMMMKKQLSTKYTCARSLYFRTTNNKYYYSFISPWCALFIVLYAPSRCSSDWSAMYIRSSIHSPGNQRLCQHETPRFLPVSVC